jgi:hypothetical protein
MDRRRPPTPAEKEMRARDLPPDEERGEDQFPVEDGGLRHPRTEGKGGLPDPGDEES